MKFLLLTGLFISSLSANIAVSAAPLSDVNEIIEQANLSAFYQGQDASAQARMKITDSQGNVQIRQFSLLRKNIRRGGDQQFLIAFSRPSDVKGMMFRVEKHLSTSDDRWLYLPALDLVKRISAADQRTSFVGSHFFYEDISGRNTQLDRFTLTNTTEGYYIIEARPKAPASVEFSSYVMTIDRVMMLPIKIEYFNRNKELYRTVQALKIKQVGDFFTVLSAKASNHIDGSSTLIQFRRVRYNIGLPSSIFSERSLRNPPSRWLK